MENINWLKQTKDQPAFADLLWSRPENKRYAGKLLIIGGNLHAFSAVSSAFAAAGPAGIGTARVMLPDKLERTLAKFFPEAEFAPSSLSGSFARTALGPMCDGAAWSDGVLLAGDFGKNSETAILLESFIKKYTGLLTMSGDSLDYFAGSPNQLLDRTSTTIVADLAQLQKLLAAKDVVLKHSMDLLQLIKALADVDMAAALVTYHSGQIIVTAGGQVSTTPAKEVDLIKLAAYASVWRLQQPAQPLAALTCAVYCLLV